MGLLDDARAIGNETQRKGITAKEIGDLFEGIIEKIGAVIVQNIGQRDNLDMQFNRFVYVKDNVTLYLKDIDTDSFITILKATSDNDFPTALTLNGDTLTVVIPNQNNVSVSLTSLRTTQEQVEDFVNGLLAVDSNLVKSYDDTNGTLTISLSSANITKLSNLSGTNTGDQDISGIATNASDITILQGEQIAQDSAIALNTAKVTNATHTGEVTGSTALTIAPNAVTSTKIATNAITTAKLADDAVTEDKITEGAVTQFKNALGISYKVADYTALSAITGMSNGDVAVVTNEGIGGTFVYDSTLSATDDGGVIIDGWVREIKEHISPLFFGAKKDNVSDDKNAFQSMFDYIDDNSIEHKVLIPSGKYYISGTINLPSVINIGKLLIEGYGATLRTDDDDVVIFNHVPPNQTEASNWAANGYTPIIKGLEFVGDKSTGQVGVHIAATYTARIQDCVFRNLEIGSIGTFSLASKWVNNRYAGNTRAGLVVQSGGSDMDGNPVWTDATLVNSASNVSMIEGNRVYGELGQTASYVVLGSDLVVIQSSISEGNGDLYDVFFDYQGSNTVKNFTVNDFHAESPSGKVNFKVKSTGTFYVNRLRRSYPSSLFDLQGSADLDLSINGISYLGNMPTSRPWIYHEDGGGYGGTESGTSSGVRYDFNNISDPSGLLDSGNWEDDVLPYTLRIDYKSSSNQGSKEYNTNDIEITSPTDKEFTLTNYDLITNKDIYNKGELIPTFDYGSNVVVNGNFDTTSNWTIVGTSTLSGNTMNIFTSDGSYTSVTQSNIFTIGKKYIVEMEVISTNGASISNNSGTFIFPTSTTGVKRFVYAPETVNFDFKRVSGVTNVVIDNVSAKEIVGSNIYGSQVLLGYTSGSYTGDTIEDALEEIRLDVTDNVVYSGTTANRPATPYNGQLYSDTDLGKLILYNGSAWVNVDGTAL